VKLLRWGAKMCAKHAQATLRVQIVTRR
jgi:hypothetical protein